MVMKIAVVTGTRADFGLLQPLLDHMSADAETALQLIVTGMHLSPEFGSTINEIKDAGFHIADEVEMLLSSDSSIGIAKSVGLATIGFADCLRRLRPDWLVILGDRFEVFAASTAAMLLGVPIAHIHGGEKTEGAIDESIRHCITKMAQLHFTSTPEYQRRVVQLGEQPQRVFDVGAIGLDRIETSSLLSKEALAQDLDVPVDKSWCLVAFHPPTHDCSSIPEVVQSLVQVMKNHPELFFVITKANADEGGRAVNILLAEFAQGAPHAKVFDSLGSYRYLSCLQSATLAVGNSSSFIIEAPYLKTPSVNIGDRQKGRASGASVINCLPDACEIERSIRLAIDMDSAAFSTSPYHRKGAPEVILKCIKAADVAVMKAFYDVKM